MVEYAGETEADVRAQVEKLEEVRKREKIGYASTLAFRPEEVKAIWGVRKAGLGLLLGTKGDKKPIAFVEDTAVEPARLPEFIKRFREVVARHDTVAGYYGHCSVGCMHIRPLINLKDESERKKMVSIANAMPISCWSSTAPCRASMATVWRAATLTKSYSDRRFTKRFAR
jgi:FAD/FMN-containing dehydrogenase